MENPVIKIATTSNRTATVTPFPLRENSVTRLLFCPELVDNVHDKDAAVKGTFVFQRKSPKGEWETWSEKKLSELKAGEGFALSLNTSELKKLHQLIGELLKLHRERGGVIKDGEFELTPGNAGSAIKQILKAESLDMILKKLQELQVDDLQRLNSLTGIANLKKALAIWEENRENGEEEFWQAALSENSWVLSQLFSYPVIIFEEKAYVGGKSVGNTGGGVIDFILQNHLTKNTALLEIKTPKTPLLSPSEYRVGVYALSSELSGALSQALSYRHRYLTQFNSIVSEDERESHAFNPKTFVLVGDMESQRLDGAKKKSFELHRCQLKDVEIITFDELFQKAKYLVDLMETPTERQDRLAPVGVPF